ncbi:MAG TPA: hypothetical protein VNO33_08885 [Kofleriaceae bacterium]|nr:hypothetical protein [Kofleriaceae bacterium]
MATARIGELLVHDGVVTAEARERALRSQAVHGGRLGTNLIEQFALGLDELAEGLARLHDMPAAVDRHFNQGDAAVQARLTADDAALWHAVPLGRLPGEGGRERVAVALLDPPTDEVLAGLSDALGAEVVPAIAPELRVLYHLERIYGLERANRFKRGARRSQLIGIIGGGQERRGFVRTLTEQEPERVEPTSLARIEVRRVERTRTGEIETLADLTLLGDALVAVKRAAGRNRVAELLVGALEQGFDRLFTAALVLTVRSGLLFGWKGFARGRDSSAMEALGDAAVPLHSPSVFAEPCRTSRPFYGPPPGGGSDVDRRLWRLLGAGVPTHVGVHPLAVFGQLATVLYVQAPRPIPPNATAGVSELGSSMCAALERLVQTDQER